MHGVVLVGLTDVLASPHSKPFFRQTAQAVFLSERQTIGIGVWYLHRAITQVASIF